MKYGFIGCGNMGGAIAKALAKSTTDILISDMAPKAKAFAEDLGLQYGDNHQAVACSSVFLAVKPQVLASVLEPLQADFAENKPLVITMAAGTSIAKVESMLGTKVPVIRIMPNTPVAVGKGMILYCRNQLVTDEMLAAFLEDMKYAGILDAIGEHLIDAASAVSGCGPAYMYLMIEALADGAVACGVPRDKALTYAAATMAGSAEMVLQSGTHPGRLKDNVCSPGGTTIAGVRVLEEKGFRSAAMDCVIAAYEKTLSLGK